MTTSQKTSLASELESQLPLSEKTKAYFRERIRNKIYNMVAHEYIQERDTNSLTQAQIARRLGRSPVQINRWLGAPGNWTLDTVSDLLLAISGCELDAKRSKIQVASKRNYLGPEWLQPEKGDADLVTDRAPVSQAVVVITPPNPTFWLDDQNGSIIPFGVIQSPQIEASAHERLRAPSPAPSIVEA